MDLILAKAGHSSDSWHPVLYTAKAAAGPKQLLTLTRTRRHGKHSCTFTSFPLRLTAPVDRTVSRKAPLCRTEPVRREVTKRRHVAGSKMLSRLRICYLRSKCVTRTYTVEGENRFLRGVP